MGKYVRVFTSSPITIFNHEAGKFGLFQSAPSPVCSEAPAITCGRLIDLDLVVTWLFTDFEVGWTNGDAFVELTEDNQYLWGQAEDFKEFWARQIM